MAEINNAFVVVMGIGTVFIGLICIIIVCKIVGFFCNIGVKKSVDEKIIPTNAPEKIQNKEEIIAAVTAAGAEDMGKDVSALRVLSFKKI